MLFLTLVTLCGVADLLWMKVPNRLTVPLLVAGIAYRAWVGDLWGGLLGALVWFAVGVLMAATGGMGGGDVKFIAAIGAWMGAYGGLLVVTAGSLVGLPWAVARLARLGLLKQKALYIFCWLRGLVLGVKHPLVLERPAREEAQEQALPFAAFLAAGVWLVTAAAWYARYGNLLRGW
jgi:prepilin peptidase CpaA